MFFHEPTAAKAMELLYNWVQANQEDRHCVISVTGKNWQVTLNQIMRQSTDWDVDVWVKSRHGNGPHLWHLVIKCLEDWNRNYE
jgi:hypothetical protein